VGQPVKFSLRVKCQVYKAIVLSTLLYGAETWTIYKTQVKKLNSYIMRHLREIIKLTWKDKISNHEIYIRSGLTPMADMLIEQNLRWTDHVHKMDEKRLPRQLLYPQLSSGKRNQALMVVYILPFTKMYYSLKKTV